MCTALMNNDLRAAQILQMYGADASKCDRQIKQYNNRNKPRSSGGLFGGLSSAQSIVLAAAGAAVIVGGLFLLTDWLDPGNGNKSSTSGGSHGGGGGGSSSGATAAFTTPYGPAMTDAAAETANYVTNLDFYSPSDTTSSYYKNYNLMNNSTMTQNYLLMMHGYSPMARGYNGLRTLRYAVRFPVLGTWCRCIVRTRVLPHRYVSHQEQKGVSVEGGISLHTDHRCQGV